MAIRCLLVGINKYPNLTNRNLDGCINDVELMAKTLQNRFSVDEEAICPLTDEQATREEIIKHFQSHLTDSVSAEDSAVFYFSGHGGQYATVKEFYPIEPDRRDESLVCYDSRADGIPDLRDKELSYLIYDLSQRCKHVLIILDCCHGGHGTRLTTESAGVRNAGNTLGFTASIPKISTYWSYERMLTDLKTSGNLKQGKHVLLAACQDYQLAREDLKTGGVHGIFTEALCQVLAHTDQKISYHEVIERCRAILLRNSSYTQTPQLEAIDSQAEEAILNGQIQPLQYLVSRNRDGTWFLNTGALHGNYTGDQLAIFKQDDSTQDLSIKLAEAEISSIETSRSQLKITDDSQLEARGLYKAIVINKRFPKMGVTFQGNEQQIHSLNQALREKDDLSASDFLYRDDQNPRYLIKASEREFLVYPADSNDQRPLFKGRDNANAALEDVANMARFWQKHGLNNPNSSIPADDVQLVINYQGQEYINQDIIISYTESEDESWLQPEVTMELRLNTTNQRTYYCGLLFMDGSNGSITDSLIPGSVQMLTSIQGQIEGDINQVKAIPVYGGRSIPFKILPELLEQGVTQVQDYLKLIVCEGQSFDVTLMNQEKLQLYTPNNRAVSGLPSLLNRFMENVNTRSLGIDTENNADWMSRTVSMTIRRPGQWQSMQYGGSKQIQLEGEPVTLATHTPIHGRFRLHSSVQLKNNSNASNRSLKPSEKQEVMTDATHDIDVTFEPFYFFDASKTDNGLDLLEIQFDATERNAGLAEDTEPAKHLLTLNLPTLLKENENIIPCVYNGDTAGSGEQWLLPIGYSATNGNSTDVFIDQLPTLKNTDNDSADRGLTSALRIYFRKITYKYILRKPAELQFLGIPQFDQNDNWHVTNLETDTAALKAKIELAQSILLVIHGVIGETESFVGFINQGQTPEKTVSEQYDLTLTFDYENLNTPIQDTARILKNKLHAVGIHEQSNKLIDIIAHSMGGLVSRWLIECEGGDAFVRSLIMAGTPNGGSPYSGVKENAIDLLKPWAYGTLATALNGLTAVPVGGAAVSGLLKLIDSASHSLDQMAPDSELLMTLQNNAQPNCSYLVILGNTDKYHIGVDPNSRPIERLWEFLKKHTKLAAYEILTERLFKESNDIAVSVSSMQTFNPAWRDTIKHISVDCDHLSYFTAEGDLISETLLAQTKESAE